MRDALAAATAELAAAGCDTPRLDAEVLLADVLGVDRGRLFVRDSLDPDAAALFAARVARRRAREPVAYIVGRRGFRGIEVEVDRRVLIPRPETEHVVEAALALPAGCRVVDVGTGSGAIALALKGERPDLSVVGVDVSADALRVACANGERLGIEVEWYGGDLLGSVPDPLDAVVSNPPYVAEGSVLAPEIAEYEPAGALFAGPDGLAVYRRLLPACAARRVAFVALEVGAGQAPAVAALARAAGYAAVDVRPDLAGIPRVVVARRGEWHLSPAYGGTGATRGGRGRC